MTSAIYYQKSAVVQEEFKLIEVTTLREIEVEKLQKVIREVKERRRVCDDAAILETFSLFNRVRETTIDLIRSISIWQESFTKPIRPQLLDCDYIVVRLINHIDFINSSELKRTFNFQFYRGNVLLLPYLNPKTAEPVRVSTALGKEIKKFAAPSEETVVFCYQFLINCLPDDVYENKLAPLKRWLMQNWVPRVWVLDVKPVVVAPPPPLRKQASSGALSQTNSSAGDAEGISRLSRRRSTLGSGSAKSIGSNNPKGSPEPVVASTKMKRRNQMQAEEAAQASNLAIQPNSPTNIEKDLQAQQLEEYARLQRLKREKEADQLDTYFKEMELLFIPALGRRAVQTIAVGGTRQDVQDYFHQPEKIVFHHTLQEEREQLEQIVSNNIIPANAKRSNAEILAKRNRIMADRGKPTIDIQYMTASGKRNRAPSASNKAAEKTIPASSDADKTPQDGAGAASEAAVDANPPTAAAFTQDEIPPPPPSDQTQAVAAEKAVPSSTPAPLVGILYTPGPAGEQGVTGTVDGVETTESRKLRRRESRRMSDLTITFSVNDGHTVNDELDSSPNRNITNRSMSPNKGKSSRTSAFTARTGSPSKKSSTKSPTKQNQTGGIALQESPSGKDSAATSPTSASQRNRATVSTPPSGSRRSKSIAGESGTNTYGNQIRAETPPPASSTLALSTKDMRMWFAQQEQLDIGSQATD